MAFHNGLTLAEIVWMSGHQDGGPVRAVASAYDAFEAQRTEDAHRVFVSRLDDWRSHHDYPFEAYLLP